MIRVIVFAAVIVAVLAATPAPTLVSNCSLTGQYMTYHLNCISCNTTTSSTIGPQPCCPGAVVVNDTTDLNCCKTLLITPGQGLSVCEFTSSCFGRLYGNQLTDLSIYLDDVRGDFTDCTGLTASITPVYESTTLCANCTAPPGINFGVKTAVGVPLIAAVLWRSLWIAFAL